MPNPAPPPGTIQEYIYLIPVFLSNVVIPFLLGIAFLIFVVNAIRYFVIGGSNEDAQESARSLAIYGLAAFVVIIIFWGVITMLAYSFGFAGAPPVCPDYLEGAPNGPC